ncbi:MAG TPA: hypothetical protein VFT59_00610 [Candidatus Saccharimonadales bacterium]|nr:hypothetical protein [Candidatus Saccharimonadales bacterium]
MKVRLSTSLRRMLAMIAIVLASLLGTTLTATASPLISHVTAVNAPEQHGDNQPEEDLSFNPKLMILGFGAVALVAAVGWIASRRMDSDEGEAPVEPPA